MELEAQVYKELGDNFRISLLWREKLFGGYIVILGSLAIGYYKLQPDSENIRVLLPLLAFFTAMAFWGLDVRCHEVLRKNYEVGSALEKRFGYYGTYRLAQERSGVVSHTFVLQTFYIATGLVCLAFALYMLRNEPANIRYILGLLSLPFGCILLRGTFYLLALDERIWFRNDSAAQRAIHVRSFVGLACFIIGICAIFYFLSFMRNLVVTP